MIGYSFGAFFLKGLVLVLADFGLTLFTFFYAVLLLKTDVVKPVCNPPVKLDKTGFILDLLVGLGEWVLTSFLADFLSESAKAASVN